jgi:hypothetical protein
MWGNIPTPHGPCSYCNSPYHHVRNCPTAGQFSNYSFEHMNRPFSRPENDFYSDSYNPAWSNQSNFSWQAQDHGMYAPQGHELHHQSYSLFNDQSYYSQYQETPQQQYQATPPPQYDSNFEDRVLQMIGEMTGEIGEMTGKIGEMNGMLDELNDKFGEMTQTINSHSQSIASLEAQAELIADILDREEEELQSQPVSNPNEHYMVDESTYPEQAITTLRSGEVVETQVEERKEVQKEEQIEAPQDLLREKCKEGLIPGNLKISFLDIGDTLPVISSYYLPIGRESRLLGLLEEQKETIEVEKFLEYSPHFTPVHDSLPDEKLFENTQRDLPQYTKIQNYLSIGKIHSLWSKRRKDWCFKFKLKGLRTLSASRMWIPLIWRIPYISTT